MNQKNGTAGRGEAAKRFVLTVLGSLFVQCFCWAVYGYLELSTWLCGLSAVVTALLYHFIQREEETGLSRTGVFFAAILTPFLLSAAVTVIVFLRHPQIMNTSAALDGVSPLTETVSVYSARLLLNGLALLIFAGLHAVWTAAHPPEERETNDTETS